VIVLTAFGTIPPYAFIEGILVGASISLLNQVRTIVAHRWESEGDRRTYSDNCSTLRTCRRLRYFPDSGRPLDCATMRFITFCRLSRITI
jgi:hypothetical protein